ncbi:Hydroxyethylthiazole kinase [Corynebacterium atrinae]|uniref:hydroxyethylthiazole kinase n=1 Tax=Corynebacterium atrinae TaxID=1336740 RepID=UPI0025B3E542|nr:hydroxyethylthiazole kinase [Corynebacterium atrinae]WJY63345.1 Hydroxyethylthiazole kinase [Corynebacterium atrinae]
MAPAGLSTSSFSALVASLREHAPLVQCLTNTVAQEITANVLLAAGACPVMADSPLEAGEIAAKADAVLINSGTPSRESSGAMLDAIAVANERGKPWVLDPVGIGASTYRTDFLLSVLDSRPTAIRGNASEIRALAGEKVSGKGTASLHDVPGALNAAHQLAERISGVVAISGPVDLIVSPSKSSWVTSGSGLLQRIAGTGCSLGALTAAYLAIPGADPHSAVIAAHAHVGAAAQIAARKAMSPGSFRVAWLDALDEVCPDLVQDLVNVEDTQ